MLSLIVTSFRRLSFSIYLGLMWFRFQFRRHTLGFEYAYKLFETMDKRLVVSMLRKCGAEVGDNCRIESPLRIHRAYKPLTNLKIGNNVAVSKGVLLDLGERIKIGNNVTIAMDVSLITHEHYADVYIEGNAVDKNAEVIIGNNIYIGTRTIVLCGVEISCDIVVGALSLVNKSISERGVYVGIPARHIRL